MDSAAVINLVAVTCGHVAQRVADMASLRADRGQGEFDSAHTQVHVERAIRDQLSEGPDSMRFAASGDWADYIVGPAFATAVATAFLNGIASSWESFEVGDQTAAFVPAALREDSETLEMVRRLLGRVASNAQQLGGFGEPSEIAATAELARTLAYGSLATLRPSVSAPVPIEDDGHDVFEREYCAAVADREGKLRPPNLEGASVPLQRLYVAPRFATGSKRDDLPASLSSGNNPAHRSPLPLHLEAPFSRIVVLGSPGAGKSTFTQATAVALAENRAKRAGASTIPLVVVLREFAAADGDPSIEEYIVQQLKRRYRVDVPPQWLEGVLRSGRSLVIFDGLDELLDLAKRAKVRDDVEGFVSNYPFARVLVTSRTVGYFEAPLDPQAFMEVRIADFDENQVSDYIEKWYGVQIPNVEERRALIKGFKVESRSVSELRRSPLLLALMCTLYRRRGYIPRDLAGVYAQCAEMLFDRWDREREIDARRPLEVHWDYLLGDLATWILEDQGRQAGVTEAALVERAAEYVRRELEETDEVARDIATEVIAFCRGRGWVLVGVGSTSLDEELYAFAHRTFLEFFAALHLAAGDLSERELVEQLVRDLSRSGTDVVATLSLQLRAKRAASAGRSMMLTLVRLLEAEESTVKLAMLAARALEYLVPPRSSVVAVTTKVVSTYLDAATLFLAADDRAWQGDGEARSWGMALGSLAHCNPDNSEAILTALEEHLVGRIEKLPGVHARGAALGLALDWRFALVRYDETVWSPEDLRSRVLEHVGTEVNLRELAIESLPCAYLLWRRGLISTAELLEAHGFSALWAKPAVAGSWGSWGPSPAECMIRGLLGHENGDWCRRTWPAADWAIVGDFASRLDPAEWASIVERASGDGFLSYLDPGKASSLLTPADDYSAWPEQARLGVLLVAAIGTALNAQSRRRGNTADHWIPAGSYLSDVGIAEFVGSGGWSRDIGGSLDAKLQAVRELWRSATPAVAGRGSANGE